MIIKILFGELCLLYNSCCRHALTLPHSSLGVDTIIFSFFNSHASLSITYKENDHFGVLPFTLIFTTMVFTSVMGLVVDDSFKAPFTVLRLNSWMLSFDTRSQIHCTMKRTVPTCTDGVSCITSKTWIINTHFCTQHCDQVFVGWAFFQMKTKTYSAGQRFCQGLINHLLSSNLNFHKEIITFDAGVDSFSLKIDYLQRKCNPEASFSYSIGILF